ncbi:BMY1, partial [Symbiodinium pilosum]
MQSLIASRVELLEKTSGQKYCGACIRRLVRVQICFAFLTGLSCASILLVSGDLPFLLQPYHLALASFTVLFNILTTMMVALSLTQFFRHLRKVLQLAELSDMSVPARSSLRRARRFAALQFTGVLLSLVLTICVVPCIWKSMLLNSTLKLKFSGLLDLIPLDASVVVQACDLLGNALGVLLLSGSHRLPKADGGFGHRPVGHAANSPKAMPAKETDWNPAWKGKVEELSLRGMTLRSLLRFYQDDLPSIRDWQYAPKQHKTRDVARRAIIPLTSNEEAAYAVSVFNRDGGQRAQVMVTHNWANCFKDLLAAVLSDALQECSFSLATRLLEGESDLLCEMLTHSGRLDDTYWICAFAVNQHICICHSTLTTGSIVSEINKFDDMMYHLATTGGCRQVIAVDQQLDLFNRAWCVAEIAEAKRLQMNQALKLASKATIMQRARTLENLDVRNMRASSETDKQLILNKITKITNVDQFNTELQALIFDPKSGLLASWNALDSLQQVGEVGETFGSYKPDEAMKSHYATLRSQNPQEEPPAVLIEDITPECSKAPAIKKGFLNSGKAGLYGPEGSKEGVLPENAGDPLGYIPKGLRKQCKIVDTGSPEYQAQQRQKEAAEESNRAQQEFRDSILGDLDKWTKKADHDRWEADLPEGTEPISVSKYDNDYSRFDSIVDEPEAPQQEHRDYYFDHTGAPRKFDEKPQKSTADKEMAQVLQKGFLENAKKALYPKGSEQAPSAPKASSLEDMEQLAKLSEGELME